MTSQFRARPRADCKPLGLVAQAIEFGIGHGPSNDREAAPHAAQRDTQLMDGFRLAAFPESGPVGDEMGKRVRDDGGYRAVERCFGFKLNCSRFNWRQRSPAMRRRKPFSALLTKSSCSGKSSANFIAKSQRSDSLPDLSSSSTSVSGTC